MPCGGSDLGRGLAEGALEFVQRNFAGTQFALQHLKRQLALHAWLGTGGTGSTSAAATGSDAAGADIASMPRSTI